MISVIVPVYNVEPYLRRCVDSILGQDYSELEVLLIDDGSTDGSGALCDVWRDEDPRVRVIHQVNGGLSHARNVGLEQARGEFVTFVDSDDWIHPTMLSRLVGFMSSEDVDLACCGFERISQVVAQADARRDPTEFGFEVLSSEEALRALVGARHTLLTIAWAKVYRAPILEQIRFPVGRLHEDEFTTYRAIHQCRRVAVTDEPMYYYWQREQSITGSGFSIRRGLDIIDAYRERAAFLERIGMHPESVLAQMQTFRKYLQLHRWLGFREPQLRARLLMEMKELVQQLASEQQPIAFRWFSRLYVVAPALIGSLYGVQAKVRGLRLPS